MLYLSELRVEMAQESQEEDYFYLAGNQTEEIVALLTGNKAMNLASRIRVFGVEGRGQASKLVQKATIDLRSRHLRSYNSICFIPRINCFDFICGYSSVPKPTFFVYSYDIYTHEVKLVKKARLEGGKGDYSVGRLERFGGMVYGLMKNGHILKAIFSY